MAGKLNAIVLSSDKVVRNHAKTKAIEYHGMLWILDKMLEEGLLSPEQAILNLKSLMQGNIIYQNNMALQVEMNKRIKAWSKLFN